MINGRLDEPAQQCVCNTDSIALHCEDGLHARARAGIGESHERNRVRRLLKRHFGEWIDPDMLVERMMEYV
jgi:hypothetical protein